MRWFILCAALAVGCSSGPGKAQVEKETQARQQALAAFKASFEPVHQKISSEVQKPGCGEWGAYDRLEKELENVQKSIQSGPLEGEERSLVTSDKLLCTSASLMLAPYSDAEMKAMMSTEVERWKAKADIYKDLDHLASEGRVRFELAAKPIPPEKIKTGAHLVDGETGKSIGWISNPNFQKGSEVFVCVKSNQDGSGLEKAFERYQVERGVDYRIAD